MSGSFRKIGEYLGLLEDTGRYDDYTDEVPAYDAGDWDKHAAPPSEPAPSRQPPRSRPAPVADISERRRPQAVPDVELSKIVTVSPKTYNDARTIGENYRDGVPVIMNLNDMADADAKRLVDFAAGLIFATRGDIERVTSKVFLLSPPNVTVAAEAKARIAQGGFFNQS
jgi:cell division inhibitor SepF